LLKYSDAHVSSCVLLSWTEVAVIICHTLSLAEM
jgi:hypothetical protein